jgi:hypothetical protein
MARETLLAVSTGTLDGMFCLTVANRVLLEGIVGIETDILKLESEDEGGLGERLTCGGVTQCMGETVVSGMLLDTAKL